MPPALVVVVALATLIWVGLRYASSQPTSLSPDDPLWRAAVARARATVDTLRALHAEGRVVWVKFSLDNGAGEREHVWGLLLAIDAAGLRCTLETPPKAMTPSDAVELHVSWPQLEDWQVLLDDGSIRGGFTTRAQLQIADRDGQPVPRHVRELVARMID